MKKILFIHHSGRLGGAPRSLRLILDALSSRDRFDVDVMLIKEGPSKKVLDNGSVNFIHTTGLFPFHGSTVSKMSPKQIFANIYGVFSSAINFYRYLDKNYDVIHLNSTCLSFFAFLIKLKYSRSKIYCHVREPLLPGFFGGVIRKIANKYVDHFFAISCFDASTLKSKEDKITIVYNYVDINLYMPKRHCSCISYLQESSNIDIVIGFFARLDVNNGILDFIELASLFEGVPECHFVVFGQTDSDKHEVCMALDNSGNNLSVYPMTSEVVNVLSDIDLLVCPFVVPHFSRSVIEAAALETPSIIYDVGSLNELVIDNKTGFVCGVGDVYSIKDKIDICRKNPKIMKRMGVEARILAEDKFSHSNVELILNKYECD